MASNEDETGEVEVGIAYEKCRENGFLYIVRRLHP
jgi:hypothetical protein